MITPLVRTLRPLRHGCVLVLVAAATACQSPIDLASPLTGDPAAARDALAETAASGPVPLEIRGRWPGLDPADQSAFVSDGLDAGIRGMSVDFAPGLDGEERLVVTLAPGIGPAERLCRPAGGTERARHSAGDLRLQAAYCRGDVALSAVDGRIEGIGPRDARRLLRRSAAALFPDDYAETYGFGILPDGLNVETGGSVGF